MTKKIFTKSLSVFLGALAVCNDRTLTLRCEGHQQEVNIVLVGKYTRLGDAYISVIKALKHAALAYRHKLALKVE